jgi:hypothetical protein
MPSHPAAPCLGSIGQLQWYSIDFAFVKELTPYFCLPDPSEAEDVRGGRDLREVHELGEFESGEMACLLGPPSARRFLAAAGHPRDAGMGRNIPRPAQGWQAKNRRETGRWVHQLALLHLLFSDFIQKLFGHPLRLGILFLIASFNKKSHLVLLYISLQQSVVMNDVKPSLPWFIVPT